MLEIKIAKLLFELLSIKTVDILEKYGYFVTKIKSSVFRFATCWHSESDFNHILALCRLFKLQEFFSFLLKLMLVILYLLFFLLRKSAFHVLHLFHLMPHLILLLPYVIVTDILLLFLILLFNFFFFFLF